MPIPLTINCCGNHYRPDANSFEIDIDTHYNETVDYDNADIVDIFTAQSKFFVCQIYVTCMFFLYMSHICNLVLIRTCLHDVNNM